MRMTKEQAIRYCTQRLNDEQDQEKHEIWQRLRAEIKQQGLDPVLARIEENIDDIIKEWGSDNSPEEDLAAATTSDNSVMIAIAHDLLKRTAQERELYQNIPLRAYYLMALQKFLENVLRESAHLKSYAEAREGIESDLFNLEETYGKWIDDAIAAQE